ncbi:lysosomal alpha-glucosidase [Trichonephila clavipes]|nr:lysosomal alpha-glucosidase [Trichonephila clavipes]
MAYSEQKMQDSKCNREYQTWRIRKYGLISKGNKAVHALRPEQVICGTSSVKRHFETNHKSSCQKNEAACKSHGCEYARVRHGPACFMKKDSFGFKIEEVSETRDGMEVRLSNLSANTPYGPSFTSVNVSVIYITADIVRVRRISLVTKVDTRWRHHEMDLIFEDLQCLQRHSCEYVAH